jgi:hypothetical protein
MRTRAVLLAVALVSGTALLAACSGGFSGQLALSGTTTSSQSHAAGPIASRTGVAPQFLSLLHFGHDVPRPDLKKGKLKAVAVSDFGTGAVEVLNRKYALTSTITSGINGPDGDYYDNLGNLYVANDVGINVTEYNSSGTLIGTYSMDLTDPVDVTADKSDNVYVADYGGGAASVIVFYPQGKNEPGECSTGLANEGVAVDRYGNVFVAGDNPSTGKGQLLEYVGGPGGCSATTLGATVTSAGGLQIDRYGNLIACDQDAGADIIPPPYTSISSTIASDCFHAALNKRQNLIFIAQPNDSNVLVDQYPSGTAVTTLGAANGLSDPAGVATYPQGRK